MNKNKINTILRLNVRPIALVVCCTALGGLFGGNFLTGFLVGAAIVAFATTLEN